MNNKPLANVGLILRWINLADIAEFSFRNDCWGDGLKLPMLKVRSASWKRHGDCI